MEHPGKMALRALDMAYPNMDGVQHILAYVQELEDAVEQRFNSSINQGMRRLLDRNEARKEALEEAAGLASSNANVNWVDGDGGQYGSGYENACEDIAQKIRSLTKKGAP